MSPSSQTLHDTNERLRLLLDELAPESPKFVAVTSEHLARVLAELLLAGEFLRDGVAGAEADPELSRQISEYRKNVERLRSLLPTLHANLLNERAGLESERAHLESAAEWARASRKISSRAISRNRKD